MKYYTIDQISTLNEDHKKLARFAVIGNPVQHSLSPQLHQPALDDLGENARYLRIEVKAGQVKESFQKLYGLQADI